MNLPSVMEFSHFKSVFLIGFALLAFQMAHAQEPSRIPSLEVPNPGAEQTSRQNDVPAVDMSAFVDVTRAEALAMQFNDAIPHTRSAQDVLLFRQVAPSVVLIFTLSGIGSGSILQNNVILTSLHVVGSNREVTIVFKPTDPSGQAKEDEVVKGDVIKRDVQRDLALIRPRSLPKRPIWPLELATKELEVGTDVHAIGHPRGEEWTYTKGVVSSMRSNYQ